ncbi:diguanylate cyclase [Alteromonas sp. SM 2104]|nr:diguanylate cyclase [Alteromonas oceanisediminis]
MLRRLNDRKAQILIVDDQIINAEILANGLSDLYDVIIATSGQEALACAKRDVPDLILLDIRMPDIDGYAVLSELQETIATQDIPVIFVTGEDSMDDELKGLQHGAKDYVRKPFELELVKARVSIQIELKRKTDLLNLMASADGLTGLANRRKFDESLTRLIRDSARHKTPLALILLDIDFFKQYNDLYGHAAGDRCLIDVSAVLATVAKRTTDVVARVGGEEFALLLPNMDTSRAALLCEKLHRSIAERKITHEGSLVAKTLTVSIGATIATVDAELSSEAFYKRVDKLLYQAKANGRAQTCLD